MFKKVRRITKEKLQALYNACFNRPVGKVYMFHRVSPADGSLPVIDELRVSPDFFRQFLLNKAEILQFVTLQEAVDIIEGRCKIDKPFGVITFDDGYEDNYIYAYPILNELGIPFTVYVSVDLVNDYKPIWNYPLLIEKVVRMNDELMLKNDLRFSCKTLAEKNAAFIQLKSWLFSLPYKNLHEEFTNAFGNYLTDDVFEVNTLTWEQIQKMANDPLCTIGSHTMSHCRLAMKDVDILTYELKNSKDILSEKIGKPVEHLSYPYGWITDVSVEAAEIAKRVGYKTAFHSFGGPIRKKDKDLYHLKRIMVNE